MLLRKFKLTVEQEKELEIAYDYCDEANTRTRYQAVRLYGTQYCVEDICQICRCSVRSLLEWCQRYQSEGISGLVDKRSGGNRARLSSAQKEELKQLLHQYRPNQWFSQAECGSNGEFWDIALLAKVVQKKFGVVYKSQTSYRTLFVECEFSYQRTTQQYKAHNEGKVMAFEEQLEKN
jgi:transposase